MQTGHKHNLVKRMRYYHSAIDVDSLLRGNPYDQLKKSYVIFICNFDLCGDGFPVYESQTIWKQNGREIGDEQGTRSQITGVATVLIYRHGYR